MKLKNFRDGLDIISAYYDEPDGYNLGAEHDQIYLYATDHPISSVDQQRLSDMGWFQPEAAEDEYCPDEAWACYV